MPTIEQLRERSAQIFTDLLVAQTKKQTRSRGRGLAATPRPAVFSWFEPRDAAAASELAVRLSAFAASKADANSALEVALDHADAERPSSDPELIRQGLALFVTHNHDGRRLLKPRTVTAAPALFRPPLARTRRPSISIGGVSPGLDYWREDALANEHHQHWHEVYPYSGLPPADVRMWAAETAKADIAAILNIVLPGRDWSKWVVSASVSEIAKAIAQGRGFRGLHRELYGKLFRLNDRQGELFFYMHQQMLARYDAELLSNRLPRVDAFGGSKWAKPIDEGHDPVGLPNFTKREQDQRMTQDSRQVLMQRDSEIRTALQAKRLRGPSGQPVAIDRTNLGEAVEATVAQLRDLDPTAYLGLHNAGHGAIASLSPEPGGVMRATTTAIRDQIFWRWHKHIDDFNAAWQDAQPSTQFGDAPAVLIRDGLVAGGSKAWASPDIILALASGLPLGRTSDELEQLGNDTFGGDAWDTNFSGQSGSTTVPTTDELVTSMRSAAFGGRTVSYLTHEPFAYFLRLENPADTEALITVRIFLAPERTARDRRAWIEMDKFMATIPARTRRVVYRPDTESSVIKRPAETAPSSVTSGTPTGREESYCDCGWPYTLLLPKGLPAGMKYRLLVACTDGAIDQVEEPDHCGSMSYCGSMDRYPDTRDMGYPFARPLGGASDTAIRDATLAVGSIAARTVTIRHA